MKPSNEKEMHVTIKNKIIMSGCTICMSTKNNEVINMTSPMNNAFDAAAQTYPITISKKFTGADKAS